MGPISDIVSLLELEFGIRIFIRPLSAGSISGLFAFDETVGACILTNKNHPQERRALTAAHEFGHFLTTRNTADVFEYGAIAQSREERLATVFSFALLDASSSCPKAFR